MPVLEVSYAPVSSTGIPKASSSNVVLGDEVPEAEVLATVPDLCVPLAAVLNPVSGDLVSAVGPAR
jgi:hypothetical protein